MSDQTIDINTKFTHSLIFYIVLTSNSKLLYITHRARVYGEIANEKTREASRGDPHSNPLVNAERDRLDEPM